MVGQKIRIYPNQTQQALLDEFFGYSRWCFNEAFRHWQSNYNANKKPSQRDIRDELKQNIPSWAPEHSTSILDTSCEHLGTAFSNFFAKRTKYPKFKSKHNLKQSFEIYRKNNYSIVFYNRYWLFQNQKIKMSEALRFSGTVKRLTCSKINKKYYISIIFDNNLPKPVDNKIYVGLDWGIKNAKGEGHYFTASDGNTYDLPNLRQYEEKIRYLQESLSRKKKNSKAYAKARAKLSNCIERTQNLKKEAQNQLVHKLVNTYSHIAIESLSMKSMVKKSKRKKAKRRAILRYSNYDIQIALKCKAFDFNRAPKVFASSQICSKCGKLHKEMRDEKIRVLKCSCNGGISIDRDLNAATNILNKVFKKALLAKNNK